MNESNDLGGSLAGRIGRLGLGIAVLFSAGTPVFAQEDSEVRWHDVSALTAMGAEEVMGVDMRLHMTSSYLDSLEPDSLGVDRENRLEWAGDNWADVITSVLGDEELEVEARSGVLRVVASKEVQEQVAGIVADMKAQFLGSVEMEVFVLPADVLAGQDSAVLSRADVDALLESVAFVDASRKLGRLGQRLILGNEGRAAILVDYDVEVATKARSADPQVTVLREGTRVGVLARARPGGGFFLRAWGRRGTAEETSRTIELGQLGSALLELPRMQTMLAVGSAAIEDGGGLLLGQDWQVDGAWLVRVSGVGPRLAEEGKRSRFVSLGELAAQRLAVQPPHLPQTDPSGGWSNWDETMLDLLGDEARDEVCELDSLVDRLRDERDRLNLGGEILLLDDALYVHGSSALLELAALRVEQQTAALHQQTARVELRFGVLDAQQAQRLTATSSPDQIAEQLEHRLRGACRLGDTLLVLGGLEQFYLMDHDVEIAEAASIHDPIVGNRFEGVSFWCRPVRTTDDVLSLCVDLAVQTAGRETRVMPVATWTPREVEQTDDDPAPTETFELTSNVELPSTARADLRSVVQVAEGEWTLLCVTGFGGAGTSLVAAIRVTAK